MKIRALKTTHGSYGLLRRGGVAEIPDDEARGLISKGYAVGYVPPSKLPAAPHNDAREVDDGSDPFTEPRIGGLDGEVKPSPLSQEDRPQRKRRSTSPKDDAE